MRGDESELLELATRRTKLVSHDITSTIYDKDHRENHVLLYHPPIRPLSLSLSEPRLINPEYEA